MVIWMHAILSILVPILICLLLFGDFNQKFLEKKNKIFEALKIDFRALTMNFADLTTNFGALT